MGAAFGCEGNWLGAGGACSYYTWDHGAISVIAGAAEQALLRAERCDRLSEIRLFEVVWYPADDSYEASCDRAAKKIIGDELMMVGVGKSVSSRTMH